MDARNEILDAIQILIGRALESTTKIYNATCKGLVSSNVALMRVNGVDTRVVFYGDTPDVNKQYRVFVPEGNMSNAFMITGGGTGGSKPTVVDYNALVGKPSINGTTVQGNQTSKDLKLYGDGNQPPYPVTSVNGQTGDVTIEAGGVTSVNGKSGDVTLTASDVGALPSTTKIPSATSDLTNDSGYITAAGAPVTSVNAKTGAVVLGASDVGALPTSGGTLTGNLTVGSAKIQTNGYVVGTWLQGTATNHLTNAATKIAVQDGSGWVYHRTAEEIKSDIGLSNVDNVKQYSASNPPPYPVASVNGKTGRVNLVASDVGAVSTANVTQTLGTSTTKVPSEKAVVDALSGAGAGDMLKAAYDPTGSVAQAGGIPDYVAGQLPTVNDATLTIQKNGTAVGTFTANASANKSINITMAKRDVGLSNVDNVKQYSTKNPPPYPVTSVNGETGDVVIEAGGGTTIVLSSSQPSGLKAGDYWYQIVT